jgi:hypothetical protein
MVAVAPGDGVLLGANVLLGARMLLGKSVRVGEDVATAVSVGKAVSVGWAMSVGGTVGLGKTVGLAGRVWVGTTGWVSWLVPIRAGVALANASVAAVSSLVGWAGTKALQAKAENKTKPIAHTAFFTRRLLFGSTGKLIIHFKFNAYR